MNDNDKGMKLFWKTLRQVLGEKKTIVAMAGMYLGGSAIGFIANALGVPPFGWLWWAQQVGLIVAGYLIGYHFLGPSTRKKPDQQ